MVKLNEQERTYAIYIRTNKRVRWQYARYEGRWATPEEAVAAAKERHLDINFEYLIENITVKETFTGEVKANG
jgi:hypothetical protein